KYYNSVNKEFEIESKEDYKSIFSSGIKLSISKMGKIQLIDKASFNTEGVNDVNKFLKNKLKLMVYDNLSTIINPSSPWGILVGIRPVKIVHDLLDELVSIDKIKKMLADEYRLSDEKITLVTEIATRERGYLYPISKKEISLYICIPFCKTRCLYCSFPSNSVEKKGKLIPSYVAALRKEIRESLKGIVAIGKKVDCIYIGGGTPTALSAGDLRLIIEELEMFVDLKELKEFTVEAGRPDTITDEKLFLFKEKHVSRICINPQTMNDETLVKIGRSHNSDDIIRVYNRAVEIGFKEINMDLIIGLMDENLEDYKKTLDKICVMKPSNITIHTLAVKRSSILNEFKDDYTLTSSNIVEDMADYTERILTTSDYVPYYMYRQKNILANLENVGYSIKGSESLYNMRIMEERHSILALGAGSASKFCYPDENRFERFSNSKGIEDYIARVDEMIDKKLKLLTLLE
ncbi:MAG: coproporphyrinogen dehydrogenase HemZ, partial [Acidaminobacteraceae bacterium]